MMQLILYVMMFISSMIFIKMNHPLAMGLMLLIQTILISLMTGMMMKTFWFSYILFLVFIGGMLVLFIYTTSLASNEMFSFSMKLTIISMIFLITSLFIIFMLNKNLLNFLSINNDMNILINKKSYFLENSLMLNKMYNYPTNMTMIILMNYLLITLIAIVKITKLFYGPLRMMN